MSLVLLLFGISSCRTTQTGNPTKPLAQAQTANSPADIIEQDPIEIMKRKSSIPATAPGDIYETKYILCDRYCSETGKYADRITTVATWDKPTEIGFIYAEPNLQQRMAFKPRKKIVYNSMTITSLDAQLVIKSKGLVPPLKQPLSTAKFTPVSTTTPMFFPENVKAPLMKEAKDKVRTGSLKILSVKKLSPTEANVYIKEAYNPPNLATIGAIEASVYGEIQELAAYYKFYDNKPDIKPQQFEKISDLVNTTPQVIQVKKW